MGNEIHKAQILHDLKENFEVPEGLLNAFILQIENENVRDNISRFFKGYTIEDNFSYTFSSLPWTKLLHAVEQKQYPTSSKEKFQVPDYFIFYENNKNKIFPLSIEVKSVTGNKETLKNIMPVQLQNCLHYSAILNATLLYAIYWENFNLWTLNTFEHFERKTSNYKLSFENAYKNDLSIILGDSTYIIDSPIYRKTIYNMSQSNPEKVHHAKFGEILKDEVSLDENVGFLEINQAEAAIIDSFANMEVISEKSTSGEDIIEVLEKSKGVYLPKLSTLIISHIALFNLELTSEYCETSRRIIVEFMKKLAIKSSFQIPKIRTTITDSLFETAFKDSWLFDDYIKR
ncbi:MAG: hypothetical protein WCO63_11370 [Bacteroidota bacterium]